MGVVYSLLHVLCCHVRCSPTTLTTLIAFLPPKPGSYHIFDQQFRCSKTHQAIILHPSLQVTYKAFFVPCINTRARSIPCVLLSPNNNNNNTRKFILFAHGNATDLGQSLESLAYLAHRLGVNILAFDYQGYGTNTDLQPNISQTHQDMLAVYKYMVFDGKLCPKPESNLILYGQSLGSSFVCELVRRGEAKYAGVILHSPLASGVKLVLNPDNGWCCNRFIWNCLCCLEVFPNEKYIAHVKSPVLVIHGKQDSAIPYHHGKDIHSAVPTSLRFTPFFPDADHNDVDVLHEAEYFKQVQSFLQHCWGEEVEEDGVLNKV